MYSPRPLTEARVTKTKCETEFIRLKSSILRGEHLHREKLETMLSDTMLAIKQIVQGSNLSVAEKDEVLQNLSQIPVTIAQARQAQRRALAKGEGEPPTNGD
jgi:hypothetical protein